MQGHIGVLATCACTALGAAHSQVDGTNWGRVQHTFDRCVSGQPAVVPQDSLIAGLPYDGSSSWGWRAQDFESVFDAYDTFLIEDISLRTGALLTEWRSAGFGNQNPFGAEDVVVRVFENNNTGLPGEDGFSGRLVLTSEPGAGFWSGEEWITSFGGQCLPAGSYFLVWAARMDFSCCGSSFFFIQSGQPTIGGGLPDNAWAWNPGLGLGQGAHFPVLDPDTLLQTGVNYLLFGEPSNCGDGCSNPDCPADLDLDGDADSDDFFLYLDRFAGNDPCADIDGDTDSDSDDFFAYLDLFANGC